MSSLPASAEEFAGRILTSGSTLIVEQHGNLIGNLAIKVQDAWSQAEVGARARGTQAELGWWIVPSYQGQGYATEAVDELIRIAFELGIRRIEAACFAENEASWRVMEKLGMRREGCYRQESLHRDGTWRDGMSYALLAAEWTKNAGE
jgi:RimJ/RimL family protein N-acetyltransferase